jgi:hypothetical protein
MLFHLLCPLAVSVCSHEENLICQGTVANLICQGTVVCYVAFVKSLAVALELKQDQPNF